MTSSCAYNMNVENINELKPISYFQDLLVIGKPQSLNMSKLDLTNMSCPKNVCVGLNVFICFDHFENCRKLEKNSTRVLTTCIGSNSSNTYLCYNLVQHAKFYFYHNGTQGITNSTLYIIPKNFTFSDRDFLFTQNFEVNFFWSNHTLNYSSYLSGNPGYIDGKPIITGNLVFRNLRNNSNSSTSLEDNYMIYRDPLDFTSNFMVFPESKEGQCLLNRKNYIPVEFGYNMYAKCTVVSQLKNNENMTAKSLCESLQKNIFKFWPLQASNDTLYNKLIGQFGNANFNYKDQWSRVMFRNDISDIINKTWGKFDAKKKILHCGNITSVFLVEILFSRVDFTSIYNQQKILATMYHFKAFKNISLSYNIGKSVDFKLRIGSQVVFYDVTTQKKRKLFDPPALNIKLPYDFFYPFVRLNNSSSRIALSLCSLFAIFGVIFLK